MSIMQKTVAALAELVGGEVIGDPERVITGVADLLKAKVTDISFLGNARYQQQFYETQAGAVLLANKEWIEKFSVEAPADFQLPSFIVCKNPHLALAKIAQFFHPLTLEELCKSGIAHGRELATYIAPSAKIDPEALICPGAIIEAQAVVGRRSVVGAGCYLGPEVQIGAEVLLHPGCKILKGCIVRDKSIVHAGAVIGGDGFGYAPDEQGRFHKIPQLGIVELEEEVEVGVNTTIDRATFGVTRIGKRTKIDNLVQIAHNVIIGADCVLCGQTGVAGSAILSNKVVVGAQVGIVGHIQICEGVRLSARSGVASDVLEAGTYAGAPLQPHRQWLRSVMSQKFLPQIREQLRRLESRLKSLEAYFHQENR